MQNIIIMDFQDEHLEEFYRWECNPEIRFKVGATTTRTFEEMKTSYHKYRIMDHFIIKSIVYNNNVIGRIELYIENNDGYIGIVIGDKTFQGHGYGTIALTKLIDDFDFNAYNIHRLIAEIYEDNHESIQFFLKNKFHNTDEKSIEIVDQKERTLLRFERVVRL